jgi:hypothetical protein
VHPIAHITSKNNKWSGISACRRGSALFLKKEKNMNPLGLILVAIGIFPILAAIYDWEWFMNSSKARIFVAILSRIGARVFYGILGLALVTFGVLYTLGIVEK